MKKVAVLGSGAWGTTLGQVMVDSGQQVLIWGRNKKVVREINRRHSNRRFLKGIDLPRELKATTDIKAVLQFADVILLAIPSQTLRENLESWKGFFPKDLPVISTLKGIEVATQLRMTEVAQQVLEIDKSRFGLITGPNLANEIECNCIGSWYCSWYGLWRKHPRINDYSWLVGGCKIRWCLWR